MTPTGSITTHSPQGGAFGIAWDAITRYDDSIKAAADPVGWPMERVRGHIVIESQGNPRAVQQNNSNGWSYGLMQVVPYGVGWPGWHKLVKEKAKLSVTAPRDQVINALYDPAINIAVGVAILEDFFQTYGTTDKASSAFFTGNPDWKGGDSVNGTSGGDYKHSLNGLIDEQKAQIPVDPIRVIVGGDYPPITYGWLADAGLHYYAYGVGHGTQRDTQHTGVDVPVACGTRLYSPISGVVDCVGSAGTPRWGQGCGAYADVDGGGVGNITIFGDSGHKLTLGHTHTATVVPGQRVTPGQQVGTSGSMNGCHVHVEVSVNRNGTYWLVEPISALRDAMGGKPVPVPVVYADRIPVAQPSELTTFIPVTVTAESVPVLQRADLSSPAVNAPLHKGDVFEAAQLQLGDDGNWYWIGRLSSRVPIKGTTATKGPVISSLITLFSHTQDQEA